LLCLAGGSAFAGKPTIAVLGLEVFDPTGQIDQTSTAVAKDLTDALRSHAKMPSGPYAFQPGSEKELIDEKLIKNCDNEAIPCMSEIGKGLGADFLVYGRVEKRPDGYTVTINLLNVAKKKFERARSPFMIKATEKDAQSIAAAAKKVYNDLTGQTEMGTLVVRANADRGVVFIDKQQKGTLSSGSATITQLPEGRYTLEVEADGFRRSTETTVTIRSGETTTIPVQLTEDKGAGPGPTGPDVGTGTGSGGEIGHTGTVSDGGNNSGWKKLAIVGGVATVGFGVGFGITWSALKKTGGGFPSYGDYCTDDGKGGFIPTHGASQSDCDHGSRNKNLTYVTGIGLGIAGGFTLFALYKAYISKDERPPVGSTMVGRRSKPKKTLVVTPVISPDGGGATLQLDW
jgi:hypothetical protein